MLHGVKLTHTDDLVQAPLQFHAGIIVGPRGVGQDKVDGRLHENQARPGRGGIRGVEGFPVEVRFWVGAYKQSHGTRCHSCLDSSSIGWVRGIFNIGIRCPGAWRWFASSSWFIECPYNLFGKLWKSLSYDCAHSLRGSVQKLYTNCRESCIEC